MTKAELFRYLAERAGLKRLRAVLPERPSRDEAGARNLSLRAGRKAQYALESSAGRPSRKSSRKGANRQKNDIQFRMKRQMGEGPGNRRAPSAR